MAIIIYHTARGIPKVKPVYADRDTDKSVYIKGRRHAKRGQWDNYYNTFEEAKEAMVSKARANVKGCTMRLREADSFLHKMQAQEINTHVLEVKI